MKPAAIIVVFFPLLFVSECKAQIMTNNNVPITIEAGTTIYITGDVLNTGTTTINNKTGGIIDLNGNWTNNTTGNIFGTSPGTFIHRGNASINGSSATHFNTLLLTGGTKTLNQNIVTGTTTGQLQLVGAGSLLDLNSRTLTVSNSATNAIAPDPGTGIISEKSDNTSIVVWTINAITGNHLVPFINILGESIPVTFNLASGDAGNVTFSTYKTNALNLPYPTVPVNVTHVRNASGLDNSANTPDRFWYIEKSNPTATSSLTFTYGASETAANGTASLRAQRWEPLNVGWQPSLPGQSNPSSLSVLVPNVTIYGVWALALNASPLPVQWLIFDAVAEDNNAVLCSWSTASEKNNDYFVVEKSRNGIDFEKAGIVKSKGDANVTQQYEFTDQYPYQGLSYYRIKQVDDNGDYSETPVKAVYIKNHQTAFEIFPNPANASAMVMFGDAQLTDELYITDQTGRVMFSERTANHLSSGFLKIDVSGFAAGIYLVYIKENGLTLQKKLVVSH